MVIVLRFSSKIASRLVSIEMAMPNIIPLCSVLAAFFAKQKYCLYAASKHGVEPSIFQMLWLLRMRYVSLACGMPEARELATFRTLDSPSQLRGPIEN